ncbi:GNAT family N-acetyltransferase [Acidicapsa acidisoli]|uniref:GNAT family N-acetyltransferase n=1 Tax=Acidicapsa acidisoli TaxID=1615681 RepID=UPI0021E01AC6|nr:GNAT family N-acetyltransferase [Acidicapsa acidisoli]
MIVIRECRGFDELQACVDLQLEVWGYSDGDVIPRRVFLVSQKIGGQVLGAFETGNGKTGDASSLVGFSFSLPGVKTGAQSRSGRPESYLHSHMLAVREGFRNQNIGARLKLAQREDALARGFERIEWTFDPVEIKNSFLNIHKLGAIVRRYEENFYGVSSSRLQGGLQTDRLVAEWWIVSPRVTDAIEGRPVAPPSGGYSAEIRVPAAIYAWKADDRERHLAQAIQAENRRKFQQAFSEGLSVVAFTRDADGSGVFHLGRWTEPESRFTVEAEDGCVRL